MKQNILIGLLAILFIIFALNQPEPRNITKIFKTISKNNDQVKEIKISVQNEKISAATINGELVSMTDQIKKLELQLSQQKHVRDTVRILIAQDTLIFQYKQITHKQKELITRDEFIIKKQDSIILIQDESLDKQDVVINKLQNKKNKSTIVAAIGGVLVGVITSILIK
jgi:glycogen debranching enzyme